jgi:hypothetical protein
MMSIWRKLTSWRCWIHAFHGALGCYLAMRHYPGAALVWLFLFLCYEVTEDWRIRDGADKDIFGAMTGFVLECGYILWRDGKLW